MWPKDTTILYSVEKTMFSGSLEKHTHSFLPLFEKLRVECLLCALWCTGNRHSWEQTGMALPPQCYHSGWADRKWTNKGTIYCDNGRKNSSKVSEQASVGAKVSRHKPRLHEDMSLELAAEGWQPTQEKETFLGVRRPGAEGTVLTGMWCPSLGVSFLSDHLPFLQRDNVCT